MYRIDNATAIAALPAPAAVGPKPNAFFTKGNPGTGVAATIVDDDWANAVQEEIANVVEGAGLVLDKTKRNQMLLALQGILARKRLTANLTLYVATTGNNANAGTIGAPWLTLQYAWDTIQKSYDLNGFILTIQVADGTYAAGVAGVGAVVGALSPASVVFNGNPGTPANVIIQGATAFSATDLARYTVQNMKLSSTANGLSTDNAGAIYHSGLIFGAMSVYHQVASRGGIIRATGNYSIIGGAAAHLTAALGSGVVEGGGITITITGTPAFANSFAFAKSGVISHSGVTFAGGATGVRYSSVNNGIIDTGGSGATYFPGNAAGTTGSGGIYT